jgi:hypothetical protein
MPVSGLFPGILHPKVLNQIIQAKVRTRLKILTQAAGQGQADFPQPEGQDIKVLVRLIAQALPPAKDHRQTAVYAPIPDIPEYGPSLVLKIFFAFFL